MTAVVRRAIVRQTCRAYAGIGPECVFDDAARYDYDEDWPHAAAA